MLKNIEKLEKHLGTVRDHLKSGLFQWSRNRPQIFFYGLLNGLRNENPKWKDWIIYFIESSIKQADNYIEKLESIEKLHEDLMTYVRGKNVNSNIVNAVFKKPFFTIKYIQQETGVSYNTAKRYTEVLVESGRIYPDDKKKNKVFRFYDLIDLMR